MVECLPSMDKALGSILSTTGFNPVLIYLFESNLIITKK
jgi:hypothetical protein